MAKTHQNRALYPN